MPAIETVRLVFVLLLRFAGIAMILWTVALLLMGWSVMRNNPQALAMCFVPALIGLAMIFAARPVVTWMSRDFE
jgi:NhaP-type Na+/H+ and K+/H+ antiporter